MTRRRLVILAAAVSLATVVTFLYLISPHNRLREPTIPPYHLTPDELEDVPIPRQIWQVFFPRPGATTLKPTRFFSGDWISMAPGYSYTLLSDEGAAAVIDAHYSDRPEINATWHALAHQNPAVKSDFLRYLVLAATGGTYTDVDTKPLVPLDAWISPELRRTTNLVIATEYDILRDGESSQTVHEVQFCQWTIATAPGHAVVTRMVDRALANLHAVAREQGTDLAGAHFDDMQVLGTTGPVAWSEVVLEVLKETNPDVGGWLDFAGMRKPKIVGDIVVLPIETFRGDWRDDWGTWLNWRPGRRSLVRHFYKGSWRKVKI